MTKNNAFKKTVRSYMEEHNLSYTAAHKMLDEESYLQGTGSITLIVGPTGTGKTIVFRELLKTQTLSTAVLLAHEEEINYVGTTHRTETLQPKFYDYSPRIPHLDNNHAKQTIQKLVAQKKYSLFAIDGLGYIANQGEAHLLDTLPSRADLILTFQFSPYPEIEDALDHLDRMNLSQNRLSKRVKLIKHLSRNDRLPYGDKNRYQVVDYYL